MARGPLQHPRQRRDIFKLMGEARRDGSSALRGSEGEEFISALFGANTEPLVQWPSLAQPSLP